MVVWTVKDEEGFFFPECFAELKTKCVEKQECLKLKLNWNLFLKISIYRKRFYEK